MLTWGKLLGLPLEVRAFSVEAPSLPAEASLAATAAAPAGPGGQGGAYAPLPASEPSAADEAAPRLPPKQVPGGPASRVTPRSAARLAWLTVRTEPVPRRRAVEPLPDPSTDAQVRALFAEDGLSRIPRELLSEARALARELEPERWGRWLLALARALARAQAPSSPATAEWWRAPWYLAEGRDLRELEAIHALGFNHLALGTAGGAAAAPPGYLERARARGLRVATAPLPELDTLGEPGSFERALDALARDAALGATATLGACAAEDPRARLLLGLCALFLAGLGEEHVLIHGTAPHTARGGWFWREGSQALRAALHAEDKSVMEAALAARPVGPGTPLALIDHPLSSERAHEALCAGPTRAALALFTLYMLPATPVVCPGLEASGSLRRLNALWATHPALAGRRILRLENGHKGVLSWVKVADDGAERLLLVANMSAHSARLAFPVSDLRAALGVPPERHLRLRDALEPGRSPPLGLLPGRLTVTLPAHGTLALEAE